MIAPQIQSSQRGLFAFAVSGELNRYQDAAATGLIEYGHASVYASYARQSSEVTTVVSTTDRKSNAPPTRTEPTEPGVPVSAEVSRCAMGGIHIDPGFLPRPSARAARNRAVAAASTRNPSGSRSGSPSMTTP